MLKLTIEGDEYFNDDAQTFEETQTVVFELEQFSTLCVKMGVRIPEAVLECHGENDTEIFG